MENGWLSLHVYYHGDHDALLLEGIRPLLEELDGRGAAQSYFYVRYWNGGPHVRLRVLPSDEAERAALAGKLLGDLNGYLQAHPGGQANPHAYEKHATFMREFRSRFTDDWEVGKLHLDEDEPFQGRDVAVPHPYEFDYPRYGGPEARALTEEHFFHSSRVALALVAGCRGNKGARMAWALLLMAAAAPALGLSREGAGKLFRRYFGVARFVFPDAGDDYPAAMGFRSFDGQREHVVASIRQAGGGAQAVGSHPLVARWREHLAACVGRLNSLREQNLLSMPTEDIVMDYLHMLNNRLGVPLPEELYLSYLLAEGYDFMERETS